MESNQPAAALSVLVFLATAGLAAAGSLYAAWRAIRSDGAGAGRSLGAVCLLLAAYGAALGIGGMIGRQRIIPAGGEKYFCELDCHLAYGVTRADLAGATEDGKERLWAVALKTRFDEKTISPRRPLDAPTWPAPRQVALIDESGRRYTPQAGQDSLAGPHVAVSVPLDQPLRPGEFYETTLVFRLPPDAVPARLLLQDDLFISQLLIGNERSPFHRPVFLELPG